ncbi:MAG: efflux transporter outer membrane subunit [Desulfuromonas sp.]|nr:efflux transporter outer membrane subunit [Desulfuromonas sp.]
MNNHLYKITAPVIMLTMLAGCALGPDFTRPAAPEVQSYTATALTAAPPALGETQQVVHGAVVNPLWWREFGSSKLDNLIDAALQASPTLAAAQATLRQAQEGYAARAGSTLYPRAEVNLSSQRQRFNPNSSGLSDDARDFDLFNASLGVNYNFDLTGSNRRALEALAANSDYQFYQLQGEQLTLVSTIVNSAINQAKIATQMQATQAILHSQEEQLESLRERVRLGQAAPNEVFAVQTQVEQTRGAIALLRNQFQHSEHLLAVLAGRAPGAGGMPTFKLEDFTLPAQVPLIVPSALVRVRPDIQAAEALLHVANAQYGVAIANLYPQINIGANLGSQALTAAELFGSGSAVWSLVGQLTQPLFDPGLPAQKRAALAAFDAAAANYQTTVLEALRQVADVLRSLENDAHWLAALSAANAAAQESLDSVRREYSLGAASYVQLLIAQQQAQRTRIDVLEAQAQRLSDSAILFQSLGGGSHSLAAQLPE